MSGTPSVRMWFACRIFDRGDLREGCSVIIHVEWELFVFDRRLSDNRTLSPLEWALRRLCFEHLLQRTEASGDCGPLRLDS